MSRHALVASNVLLFLLVVIFVKVVDGVLRLDDGLFPLLGARFLALSNLLGLLCSPRSV